MKCIHCENDAQAICQFCGRAVCAKHISEQRFASGFTAKLGWWNFDNKAVVVENAVWCGLCRVEYRGTA